MSSKTEDETLLKHFKNLGNKSESIRNESCIALVQHLAGQPGSDVVTSLQQLIKGLGTSEPALTKGSFAALVSVLNTFSTSVAPKIFFKTVDREFIISKKDEGSQMGLVLAYGAAIRGGLFLMCSPNQQKRITSFLIGCLKKEKYLSSVAFPFLHDLVQNSQKVVLETAIFPVVETMLLTGLEGCSFDLLFLVLTLHNRGVNVEQNDSGFQLFSPESMQLFAEKLVATAGDLNHPIYDELSRGLGSPNKKSFLKKFWTKYVDNLLAENDYKNDCAMLHFFIVSVKNLSDKNQVKILMTASIKGLLERNLRVLQSNHKFSEAHKLAKEAETSLTDVLTSDVMSEKAISRVLQIIFIDSHECQSEKFAGLLGIKLSSNCVKQLAGQFKMLIDGVSLNHESKLTNTNRKTAVQHLIRLIGHPSCNYDTDWKGEQLAFFLDRGLFVQTNPFRSDLAHFMKDSFFSSWDEMFKNLEVMVGILSVVVTHINDKLSSKKDLTTVMRVPLRDEDLNSWQKMFKRVSRIEQKNGRKNSAEQIFHLLFLSMGLQLFHDSKLASSALEELHSCYERMKSSKRSSKSQGEPEWYEVTVDLFLSLLSHDSHLLRIILSKTFPYLAKHLNVSTFCQILEVLDPSQNANPLTSPEDINNASDSEYETDEDASKEKQTNGKQNNAPEDSSDQDGSDEDEEVEEEEEEDDDDDFDYEENDNEVTISDKARQEIMLALGNAAPLTDTESVDLDDDFDEEEGDRMNAALGAAFRTLIQSKQKSKKKKKEMRDHPVTHFRGRVLDLVDGYLSKEPSMEITHECITPLLSLIDFCMKDKSLKGLETKAKNILNKLVSNKKFSSTDGVSEESVARQIEALTTKRFGNATAFLRLSTLIYSCCKYLVHCSEHVGASSISQKTVQKGPIVQVYKNLLIDFFTKRKTIFSIALFSSVLNLRWSGWRSIAPLIVQFAFDPKVLLFRRGQALDLLTQFFKTNPSEATTTELDALKEIVGPIVKHSICFFETPDLDSRQMQFVPHVLQLTHKILTCPLTKPDDTSALSDALMSFCQRGIGMPKRTKWMLRSLLVELGLDARMLKEIGNAKKTKKGASSIKRSSNEDDDGQEQNNENDDSDDDSVSETAEVSRRNGKSKSKKEKKMMRYAGMGNGLDAVVFSHVNSDIVNGLEPDDSERSMSDKTSSPLSSSVLKSKADSKRKLQNSDSKLSRKKKKKIQ